MHKKEILTVISNKPLTKDVYKMKLIGNLSDINFPGQFINVALDGLSLRRPISVCDVSGNELTIIYKVVGKGTEMMSRLSEGKKLDALIGLGNGYDLSNTQKQAALIGGGVGIPPLYLLCKRLLESGKKAEVIMGFNTSEEIFYYDEFCALGANVTVTTVDGSRGIKGFVTDAMDKIKYDYFYACGPLPMLKAVEKTAATKGEISLEERMGCGFGACLGCSIKTVNGFKRVCKEGPVFKKGEVIW